MAFFKSLYSNKKRLGLSLIVILILGFFVYKHFSTQAAPVRYVLAQASKQTIVAAITGTGQVSQDHTVNITPSASGKITSINVKQGDTVKAGQTIAVIDETNNTISLNQAKASLASAEASYNQVFAGATSADIALAQLGLDADQRALDNAKTNLETVKKQQDIALSNAFSNFMNSGLSATVGPSNTGNVTITISGSYKSTEQGSYQIGIYAVGGGFRYQVTGLETADGIIDLNPHPLGTRGLYIQFSSTNIPANNTWTIDIPNTKDSGYQQNLNAYQNSLSSKDSAIASAQSQIDSAQNKLEQDKINLQVKQAPPTTQAAQSAKASLINAQSQLQNAQISYSNNILKAPFAGKIAQLTGQVGDTASASTAIAVEVNNKSQAVIPLNEVDVSKIKIGDKATMTFDAIDELTVTGTVAQIDTIGTVTQGVVNYNVKIIFDVENPNIKPGMSVNVSIITSTVADVLTVPSSAVKTLNGSSFVQILDPSQTQNSTNSTGMTSQTPPQQVNVEIGLTDGTNTQIISGITEGDSVVTQTISPSKTATTGSTNSAVSIPGLGGGGNATFNRGAGRGN